MEEKPMDDFYNHADYADGKTNLCKPCQSASNRKWKEDNLERVRTMGADYFKAHQDKIRQRVRENHKQDPSKRRFERLRRTYSLTEEQFNFMAYSQKGKCAICDQKAKLNVDHCHDSGMVRGLLCFACNAGLGHFRDSAELLESALNYLRPK